jgi:hypothetical protein
LPKGEGKARKVRALKKDRVEAIYNVSV